VLSPKGSDVPLEVAGADVSSLVDTGAIPESSLVTLRAFRWRNNILALAPQMHALATSPPVIPPTTQSPDAPVRVPMVGTWFAHTAAGRVDGPPVDGMSALAPWWKVTGRVPREDGEEALGGRALAKRLGVEAGSSVLLAFGDLDSRYDRLPVVGILDAGGLEDDRMYVPLAWLQRATGRAGQVDQVLISALVLPGEAPPMPDPGRNLAEYEKWICRPFAASVGHEIESAMPGVTARPVAQLVRGEGRLVGRLNLLMLLLTGAALAAAVLGVMSTMVALVGGLLGVGIGFALAQIVGRGAFGTAVAPHPLLVPAGLALAALVCLLGAWVPLRRTAAIDPALALKAGA